jgi:hypothetical protein
MNTQKHTQGPWKSYLYGKDSYGRTIATVGANDGNNRICELCAVDLPVDSIEANAQLIALAPDLLEALYDALPCVEESEEFDKPHSPKLSLKIRALLAKAEGVK